MTTTQEKTPYADQVQSLWKTWLQLTGLCELLKSDDDKHMNCEAMHALLTPIADNVEKTYIYFNDRNENDLDRRSPTEGLHEAQEPAPRPEEMRRMLDQVLASDDAQLQSTVAFILSASVKLIEKGGRL